MIVGVVTLASEAAIFVKIAPRQLLLGNLRLTVAYTVLAVALAYLPFGLKLYSAQGVVPAPRSMPKTALLVLGGGVAYLVLYFVFGGIFYQAFTKPYYMHQVVGGELLAGVTVSRKVSLAVNEPSFTVTVIVAEPNWLLTGVTEIVRFAPEPPKTMPLLGTSVGFEDEPVRTRLEAAVSTSPIVKLIGPADPPCRIV